MGAPKAAATPAAAPADTKSRLSLRGEDSSSQMVRQRKSTQASKGSFSLPYSPAFYLGASEGPTRWQIRWVN